MLHHYLITIQWPVAPDGVNRTVTESGTVDIEPGITEEQAFERLATLAATKHHIAVGGVSVLFYSLRPNRGLVPAGTGGAALVRDSEFKQLADAVGAAGVATLPGATPRAVAAALDDLRDTLQGFIVHHTDRRHL
jgi:hypothetical protein